LGTITTRCGTTKTAFSMICSTCRMAIPCG
jgi:hypothetical protein